MSIFSDHHDEIYQRFGWRDPDKKIDAPQETMPMKKCLSCGKDYSSSDTEEICDDCVAFDEPDDREDGDLPPF